MSTSSRTAVAVHALTLLAQRGQDQLLTSAEIADSLNCNAAGVRRLLSQLRNAGLVQATEGSGGGWRLTRPARKITLYDAYAAVEDGATAGRSHPGAQRSLRGRKKHRLGAQHRVRRGRSLAAAATAGHQHRLHP